MTSLTIPEARSELARLADTFSNAVPQITHRDTKKAAKQRHEVLTPIMADLIRSADDLLTRLCGASEFASGEGAELATIAHGLRQAAFLVMSSLVQDQAWFWTRTWQAGEREADEDMRAGRFTRFHSDEELLAALDALIAE